MGADDSTVPVSAPAGEQPHRMWLMVLGESGFASKFLPHEGGVTIGRGKECDISIDDPSVSRLHARLHLDGRPAIEDIGSANGTFVAKTRLARRESRAIRFGEVVHVGSVAIILQQHVPAAATRPPLDASAFVATLASACDAHANDPDGAGVAIVTAAGYTESSLASVLTEALRDGEKLALLAPAMFAVFLPAAPRRDLEARGGALADHLRAYGFVPNAVVASQPHDGRTAEELLASSRGALPTVVARPIVGDPAMQQLHRMITQVAASDISVLLLGETGVGKEVCAELIHEQSQRRDQPFLRLNCAALSESLLESELFGHEKGAFTGATATKIGLLATADGGTVFLDEVGELPTSTQVKLLRVLEERVVLPVGGVKPRPIDVRFVAATNRDLEVAIAAGTFRSDLYYRLAGFVLVVPPLRERLAEIEPLALAFAAAAAARLGKSPPRIDPDAVARLRAHAWPGNVRELRNWIERAVVLAAGPIRAEHLPLTTEPIAKSSSPAAGDWWLPGAVERERARIVAALEEARGNQTRAAELLGISRRTLLNRLDALSMPRPRKGKVSR